MHPLWFADVTEGESPRVWGTIYARADRIWAWSRLDHEQTEGERQDFDAALLSPRCRYLIHHLLKLQTAAYPERFDELLVRYPKLEPLRTVEMIDRPIVTSTNPMRAWSYLHKVGIVR